MKVASSVFLLALVAATAMADIPSDWVELYSRGALFYNDKPLVDQSDAASIGNGYAATNIDSDTIYISGVFNGEGSTGPSHRARIPSPFSITVAGPMNNLQEAMDVYNGVFIHRFVTGTVVVEQRMFAHRVDRNVFVHSISLHNNAATGSTSVAFKVNTGSASSDIAFNVQPTDPTFPNTTTWYGTINKPELPGGDKVGVAVMFTSLDSLVFLNAGDTKFFDFYTVFATTIESGAPLSAVKIAFETARLTGASTLEKVHSAAWNTIWTEGQIQVTGDLPLSQAIFGSLYYIISSIRSDWTYGLSPGGLASNGYNGHTFWDQETWMYPALLLLYPDLARSALAYREMRVDGARGKAQAAGYAGTMFPWESAFTGAETCPVWAPEAEYEQHINGDISFAFRQYWQASHDLDYLKNHAFPVVMGIAEFWASRVKTNEHNQYVILQVQPPDEYHEPVDNSYYTNIVAQMSLRFAVEVATLFNVTVPANWTVIADNLYLPFDPQHNYHPEFDGYTFGEKIKQADVILAGYPLGVPMPAEVRQNDLQFYQDCTDTTGPAMTWGMFCVGWIDLKNFTAALSQFPRSYANVREPFKVWSETPTGGTKNFITGAGGFVQTIANGYGGIRWADNAMLVNPMLPGDKATNMTIQGIDYLGSQLRLDISKGEAQLTLTRSTSGATLLALEDATGKRMPLWPGFPITFPLGPVKIVAAQ